VAVPEIWGRKRAVSCGCPLLGGVGGERDRKRKEKKRVVALVLSWLTGDTRWLIGLSDPVSRGASGFLGIRVGDTRCG